VRSKPNRPELFQNVLLERISGKVFVRELKETHQRKKNKTTGTFSFVVSLMATSWQWNWARNPIVQKAPNA